MEILLWIFLFIAIVLGVMAIGLMAMLVYIEFKDDFEEIYGKWKERRGRK